MRILDLGCGQGRDLLAWGVKSSDQVIGLDLDGDRLAVAKTRFPDRLYLLAAGERLPFADQTFDRVICDVALPYMNIYKTVAELHRILVPGGTLSLALHPLSFTVSELLHKAWPRPVPTFYRLYVAANGLLFHITGRTVRFLNGRTESFQTRRGMRIVLKSAGFVEPSFRRTDGVVTGRFIAEASKPVTGLPRGSHAA